MATSKTENLRYEKKLIFQKNVLKRKTLVPKNSQCDHRGQNKNIQYTPAGQDSRGKISEENVSNKMMKYINVSSPKLKSRQEKLP